MQIFASSNILERIRFFEYTVRKQGVDLKDNGDKDRWTVETKLEAHFCIHAKLSYRHIWKL